MLPAGRDTMDVDKNVGCSQMRRENMIDKSFLRLAFNDCVEPNHYCGLPPKTFFSQSSDRV
jgi:hypothetical protein